MTAQIEDSIIYRKNRYSIIAMSKRIGFDPKEYGITPQSKCTACWRGYWCEYNVTSDGLFLQNLYINSADGKYPPINGVNISQIEYHDCMAYSFKDGKMIGKRDKTPNFMGHKQYKDLNIPVSYTGKVLSGNGFLNKYYIHMGFQRCWAYEQLIEFEFQDGKLVNETDHSEIAAKLREIMDSTETDPASLKSENTLQFVKDSFSLDYDVKAWWLDKETDMFGLIKELNL